MHLCVNAYLLLLLLPCTDGWSVVIGSIAQIVVRLLWRNPCILILLYPYTRSVSHPTLQSSYGVCCLRLNAFVLDTSVSIRCWKRHGHGTCDRLISFELRVFHHRCHQVTKYLLFFSPRFMMMSYALEITTPRMPPQHSADIPPFS